MKIKVFENIHECSLETSSKGFPDVFINGINAGFLIARGQICYDNIDVKVLEGEPLTPRECYLIRVASEEGFYAALRAIESGVDMPRWSRPNRYDPRLFERVTDEVRELRLLKSDAARNTPQGANMKNEMFQSPSDS